MIRAETSQDDDSCQPPYGFLQSVLPHHCENETTFPCGAEILWCVPQELIW